MGKTKEEVKQIELVALPKEFIQGELEALKAQYPDVFKKFNALVAALNSPVKILDDAEGEDTDQ